MKADGLNEATHRRLIARLYGSFDIPSILTTAGRCLRSSFSFRTFEGNVFTHQGAVQVRLGYTDRELELLRAHQRTLQRTLDRFKKHPTETGKDYVLVQDAASDPRATNQELVQGLGEVSYLLVPLLAPKKSQEALRGSLPLGPELGLLAPDGKHFIHGYLHLARRTRQKPITTAEAETVMEVARDVSQAILLAKFRDLAHLLANTDCLTGAWHFGRYFLPRLEEAFHQEPVVSVILTDVDNFKPYNDTFGHPFGSRLIVDFCRLFQRNLRNNDGAILSRMGGDEFAILLREPPEVARRVAERLRARFQKHRFAREGEQGLKGLTISVGVCGSTEVRTPEALIQRADDALFAAKQQGRNRVCLG